MAEINPNNMKAITICNNFCNLALSKDDSSYGLHTFINEGDKITITIKKEPLDE